MKSSLAFLFALAFAAVVGSSFAFEVSSEVAVDDFVNAEKPYSLIETEAEAEVDAESEALMALDSEVEADAEYEADSGRRRRRRRRARKPAAAKPAAKPAARRHAPKHAPRRAGPRRAGPRRAGPRRAAPKRAARRTAAAKKRATRRVTRAKRRQARVTKKNGVLKKLATQFKKGGAALKSKVLKSKAQLKKLAKSTGMKVSAIKKAIKHPKRTLKKAKASNRKAKKATKKARRGKRAAGKKHSRARKSARRAAPRRARIAGKKGGKKFAPKRDQTLLKGDNASLRKKLTKVVNTEPESAGIVASKNAWVWEDRVNKRLDKFVPVESAELEARQNLLTKDASDVCASSEKSCSGQGVNLRTCQISKKACFHAKVAKAKIERAVKQCGLVVKTCAMPGVLAKGDCNVAKAKCNKFVAATDFSANKAAKLGKQVRDLQLLDEEAQKLGAEADKQSNKMKPKQKFIQEKQAEFKECQAADKKVKQCLKAAKTDGDCAEAELKTKACKPMVDKYVKTMADLESAAKELEKIKANRNAAETDAANGNIAF